VAEHGDLDVLFVRRRAEPEKVQQASDDQEGDLTGHPDDPGTCVSTLLRRQILSLHPTGGRTLDMDRHLDLESAA
jgi:hypothetical protein